MDDKKSVSRTRLVQPAAPRAIVEYKCVSDCATGNIIVQRSKPNIDEEVFGIKETRNPFVILPVLEAENFGGDLPIRQVSVLPSSQKKRIKRLSQTMNTPK